MSSSYSSSSRKLFKVPPYRYRLGIRQTENQNWACERLSSTCSSRPKLKAARWIFITKYRQPPEETVCALCIVIIKCVNIISIFTDKIYLTPTSAHSNLCHSPPWLWFCVLFIRCTALFPPNTAFLTDLSSAWELPWPSFWIFKSQLHWVMYFWM